MTGGGSGGYSPAVLQLATQYMLERRLLGTKKQLYGSARKRTVTGMKPADMFG